MRKTPVPAVLLASTVRAFLKRLVRNGTDECWTLEGSLSAEGYSVVGPLYAHRVSYMLFTADIPEGLHIDHLCRNRPCVNPSHLEAVTQAENNRRAVEPNLVQVCKWGHNEWRFMETNGRRYCRACSIEANRRSYARRKAEREAAAQQDVAA